MIFEFSFKNKCKFVFIIAQTIIGMVFVKLSFSKNLKNDGAIVLNSLITECTLSFSFIFYYIEKKRTKNYKENKNLSKTKKKNYPHENLKKKEFYFCPNKSKWKFIFMCIFTSSVKFFYTFFFFFFTNYLCKQNMKDLMLNIHMIPGIFFMYFFSKNILKRNYYKHHILMIIIIPLISIPLSILNLIMYRVEKNGFLQIYNYLFYSSLLFFCTMLMYVCYKYIIENYFVSIYLLNCYEGIILTIYTILFYYLYIKKEYGDKPINEIKNNFLFEICACICNLFINLLIKYIIYIFDEMYEIIPNYGEIIIKIIFFRIEKNLNNDNFLYNFLFFLQIIFYILILFCICVLFEIIILHVYNLHTHTKKYLNILQNEENKEIMIELT